ncbi:hypothetical protein PROVRUST_06632 [Providencia rustigianii DSM 4541]|uniref:Uncharacterized protein n=1 Tax=Providencia rustigianii DSM 4541 TaxID=500637 RepID=D1P336_9GAMM|nr:hypothetical protein PROVRUST_06632 [Providencia rustigianii DSM 4541]
MYPYSIILQRILNQLISIQIKKISKLWKMGRNFSGDKSFSLS